MSAGAATIVARDMGIRRGGRWLLRPASFAIAAGVVGVAGAAGVGKSTLLATFGTLRRPTAGLLEVLGNDVRRRASRRVARVNLGYLPGRRQDPDMTAGDLLAYAGYFKRAAPGVVQETIHRFGLADVAEFALTSLPGDVRLRTTVAAACIGEPLLVLLDAPLTGFDRQAWGELVPMLRCVAPTVVVTARDADDLIGWCDQVLMLARGRLNVLVPPRRALPPTRDPWAGSGPGARRLPWRFPSPVPAGSGIRG